MSTFQVRCDLFLVDCLYSNANPLLKGVTFPKESLRSYQSAKSLSHTLAANRRYSCSPLFFTDSDVRDSRQAFISQTNPYRYAVNVSAVGHVSFRNSLPWSTSCGSAAHFVCGVRAHRIAAKPTTIKRTSCLKRTGWPHADCHMERKFPESPA